MEVGSPEFVLFLVVVCLVHHLRREVGWHQGVLAVANTLFVATWATQPEQMALVGALVGGGYAIGRGFQAGYLRGPVPLVLTIVAWVVGWGFLRPGTEGLALVGFSYLLFKHLHVCIDAAEGALPPLRPLPWFNYALGFTTWTAGPIQRYGDFATQVEAPGPTRTAALGGVNRMLTGWFKAFVIAPWLYPWITPAFVISNPGATLPIEVGHALTFYFGFYAWLYLNFSGYCDLVIGAATLLGQRLPENFDRPWLAPTVLDFWQRWHITLSQWLRDYLFTPFYRGLAQRSFGLTGAVLAYIATFLAVGLWHGPTWNYFLFGLLHGIAAALYQVWNAILARSVAKARLRAVRAHPIARGIAVLACQSYIAFTMLVFGWPLADLHAAYTRFLAWGSP